MGFKWCIHYTAKRIGKKEDKEASKSQSSHPSRSKGKVPCAHHRVVATESLNSRTLLPSCYRVVVSSRLICTKSRFQNLRSLRTCFRNSFSTLLVFQIKCFLATRNFSYTCLQYSTCKCHCCTKHGVQNHNSHAVVEARPTWRNGLSLAWIMDRRSCLFFSSFSRNPVCCNQRLNSSFWAWQDHRVDWFGR